MESIIDNAYSLASLTYNSYGDTGQARVYASLAIAHGIYINGPDWTTLDAHILLERAPERHWSYQNRLPKNLQDIKEVIVDTDQLQDTCPNQSILSLKHSSQFCLQD